MIRKTHFYFLLLLLIFISCNRPEEPDQLWLGTIRVFDRNIPYPLLLERSKGAYYLIDHKNEVIDSTTRSIGSMFSSGTIKMENHFFWVNSEGQNLMIRDSRDNENFPLYAAQFVPAQASEKIDIDSLHLKLQKQPFQTEISSGHFATPNRDLKVVKQLLFSEDRLETFLRYYYQEELVYSEKKEAQYHLFKRNGKVFLSQTQEQEIPQPIYQVSDLTNSGFSLTTFRYREEITEKFHISERIEDPAEYRIFERCLEGQPGEYYHDNLNYVFGNEYLIDKIGENAPEASGDGYITIHFTINCNGVLGHPGLEQMDRNFKPTAFDEELVRHILTSVMNLEQWPEIKPGYFYKDIHSFLMFKIRDGKITDVSP